jgi:glycosyltransferase 2 family protein
MMKNSKLLNRALILVVSIFLTFYFSKIVFEKFEWRRIFILSLEFDFVLIFIAIFVFIFGYFLRALRWQLMCKATCLDLKVMQAINNVFKGTCLNNLLPFRLGDIYRIYDMTKLEAKAWSVIVLLIVEKIIDLFTLSSGLFFLLLINENIRSDVIGFLSSVNISIEFIMISSITSVILLFKLKGYALKIAGDVVLQLNTKSIVYIKLFAYSVTIWFIEFLSFAIIIYGLDTEAIFMPALASMILGTLAAMLPSLPGYVGTFDFFALQGLLSGGLALETGGVFILLIRIVIWLPITILGLGAFMLETKLNIFRTRGA